MDPGYKGISQTLRGHTERVNCVRFLSNGDSNSIDTELISGSADKTARIWKLNKEGKWVCSAVLEGHKQAVIALTSLRTRHVELNNEQNTNEKDLIVTAATDGTLRVWSRSIIDDNKDSVECVQVIDVGAKYATSLAMSFLSTPSKQIDRHQIVLVTGNTDLKIHIYVISVKRKSQDLEKNDDESTLELGFAKATSLTGHEDWITDLSFTTFKNTQDGASTKNQSISHWRDGDVILASSSQDRYIRLWRFSPVIGSSSNKESELLTMSDDQKAQSLMDSLAESLSKGARIGGGEDSSRDYCTLDVAALSTQLSTRAYAFFSGDHANGKGMQHTVSLDTILAGHDGWVNSASWQNFGDDSIKLLTASADQSVMVWYPDADTGVWTSEARLGSVGGDTPGFLGAQWDRDALSILAHGYQGTFHLWRKTGEDSAWTGEVTLSGHFDSVQDVLWEPTGGKYLMSLSLDQTSRIYAPWRTPSAQDKNNEGRCCGWHEIARPQIHGYDLRCAAFVTPFKYISGADEKVVRVFEATKNYASSLQTLSLGPPGDTNDPLAAEVDSLPKGASLPALGLSNKAVGGDAAAPGSGQDQHSGDSKNDGDAEDADNIDYIRRQNHMDAEIVDSIHQSSLHESHPQLEEALARSTLWPEFDKLYGHPYEIFSVAVSNDGEWAATSCKGAKESHSGIRLYNTKTWKQPVDPSSGTALGPLVAHSLTITRLRFSPNSGDRYLLSVSRDRSWSLFEKTSQDVYASTGLRYKLLWHEEKAHARIIWDASWSHDGQIFVTGSRDKSIKIWQSPQHCYAAGEGGSGDQAWRKPIATIKLPDAVTAVDFAPQFISTPNGGGGSDASAKKLDYCLAVGLENGRILLLASDLKSTESPSAAPTAWRLLTEIDPGLAHVSMINRLSWRPVSASETPENKYYLASGSDDQTVRIYSIPLQQQH
ncbi:Elongator subunit elp2 [Mycoemilia scoparia]|uniref:Elongator complex protein 2 n=1 Tax=Mycoemilia scoparia TaxID=417184 RepID=A0A9W7ZSH6_9FUNG|nr:Elongator subunit elp2 [Mycoemilia scoparia]